MFGKKYTKVIEAQAPCIGELEKENVDTALSMFRLFTINSGVRDDDLVLAEKVQYIDNLHIRTDYIIHPKSAIRRTDNGRFSVEAIRAERLDHLTNLYFSLRWAGHFLGEVTQRFLTEDGWELFTLKGQEILEVNSEPYKQCNSCHETMPTYHNSYSSPIEDKSYQIPFRETRTFKLKTPLQNLLLKTGMVITKIDHPCYHSLQDLLRPQKAISVDPPRLEPVFPKGITF